MNVSTHNDSARNTPPMQEECPIPGVLQQPLELETVRFWQWRAPGTPACHSLAARLVLTPWMRNPAFEIVVDDVDVPLEQARAAHVERVFTSRDTVRYAWCTFGVL
ncbi:hypothetical protein ACFW9S_38500 [Streptomyces anulatus]|uniref:hypothetical protein n=1 Tax=Streptomyces anulatus TaxID=1892 RepID=UPI0036BDA34A